MAEGIKYENIELYHYTSIEALKSIVENKTIRLTDYRFLNDPNELNMAMDHFKDYLKFEKGKPSLSQERINKIIKILEHIKAGGKINLVGTDKFIEGRKILAYKNEPASYLYILSLTQKNDDLALWTMYGKAGVRIKLNSAKLFEFFYGFRDKHFLQGITNPYRGEVRYSNNETRYDSLIYCLIHSDVVSQDYDILLQNLSNEKDAAFQYESEYRISLNLSDEFIKNNDFVKKLFIVKDCMIKPQIEFSDFPVQDIIDDVLISPYNHIDCAALSVKEFLKYNLGKDISVNSSSIKIR